MTAHPNWRPPDAIGLCPDHGEEFYLPISLPLSNPFVRCPVVGCERLLILYVPADKS